MGVVLDPGLGRRRSVRVELSGTVRAESPKLSIFRGFVVLGLNIDEE